MRYRSRTTMFDNASAFAPSLWSPEAISDAAVHAALAISVALVLHFALFALIKRGARLSSHGSDDAVVGRLRWPLRLAMIAVAFAIAQESDPLLARIWDGLARFVVPALLGWTAMALVRTLAALMDSYAGSSTDPLAASSRRTRIAIFARSASFLIGLVTIALILFAIPAVHSIGITLMASAGLATLAMGAAAQPVLKSLIAGVQIAITEPVRLGDHVVIDGVSGQVEDITLSYVVIRSADERRLIVPTAKILESSFQNWSRGGDTISGAVTIPVMPGTPLTPIREAYLRLVAQQPDWDQRSAAMQVAGAVAGSVELKFVMSAADPAALGRLRNAMREVMLEWLRTDLPEGLCRES